MGYFQVRYNSRVVIYDRRGFIRLATDQVNSFLSGGGNTSCLIGTHPSVEIVFLDLDFIQRPLYTRIDLQYLVHPFMRHCQHRVIFSVISK